MGMGSLVVKNTKNRHLLLFPQHYGSFPNLSAHCFGCWLQIYCFGSLSLLSSALFSDPLWTLYLTPGTKQHTVHLSAIVSNRLRWHCLSSTCTHCAPMGVLVFKWGGVRHFVGTLQPLGSRKRNKKNLVRLVIQIVRCVFISRVTTQHTHTHCSLHTQGHSSALSLQLNTVSVLK